MKHYTECERLRKLALAATIDADALRSLVPRVETILAETGKNKSTHDVVRQREVSRNLFARKDELESLEAAEEEAQVAYRGYVKKYGDEISRELLNQYADVGISLGIDLGTLEAGLERLQEAGNMAHRFQQQRNKVVGGFQRIHLMTPWQTPLRLGASFNSDRRHQMLEQLFQAYLNGKIK